MGTFLKDNREIKLTCNWKEAIYKPDTVEKKNGIWVISNPDTDTANKVYIDSLEEDKSSDPPEEDKPDCSKWEEG